ncbi:hypothetical protein D9613_010916 [Agrocybe pediades]|uniref:Uncharacterized protein n=1 Tax=Agrocybe pediades TaxID=84607 RepID=A0A8H4QLD6_9AGAR|nr:hypothetical protein D9613_010916 [Agrocybe pediades]
MNLQPPAQGSSQTRQRRMTSPAGSLALPEQGRRSPRPPSPLRNGYVMDTSTGIDIGDDEDDSDDDNDDDDPAQWHRSPSPASSVSNLAASFVQRMNHFVGGIAPKSPMPTDAELEAEAERERDRSRREAEAILTREAAQRKLVEERVLAMMESAKSLPPPPSRSQTMPNPNPPSPSHSQKDSSNWWTAAKNKLTPTKEPLTPAQQVIQEAKQKEKEKEKEKKKDKGKEKDKDKEWPANSQSKFTDPAFANLHIPVAPPARKPAPPSPSSPTPSRPSISNMPPNLTPSPMRASDGTSSPSREPPPVYAQFNAQGGLDIPGTLLAIAKRFEKLEKWTVGHVRALEERMTDVEKYLVEKEEKDHGKEDQTSTAAKEQTTLPPAAAASEMNEIREEIAELQGRVGELGREMAKLATAPSRLSSGPIAQTTSVSVAPPATSMLVEQNTGSSFQTPHHRRISASALETTSPPLSSKKTPTGTRLPYPQGDYTSPPDVFSPPNSPPGSLNRRSNSQSQSNPMPISGLPNTAPLSSSLTSYSSVGSFSSTTSYGRAMSPSPASAPPTSSVITAAAAAGGSGGAGGASAAARGVSPTPSSNLPAPQQSGRRSGSVSPTPRKRYTVALGGPLVAPPDDELASNAAESPKEVAAPKKIGPVRPALKSQSSFDNVFTTSSSSSGKNNANNNNEEEDSDEEGEFGGETIGKSAAARMASSGSFSGKGDYKPSTTTTTTANTTTSSNSPSPMSNRRLRAQSAYGFSSIPGASNTTAAAALSGTPSVAPLRLRSKSTERLNPNPNPHTGMGTGTGDGMVSGVAGGRFVDPLVLRKQSRDSLAASRPIAMPKPAMGKVPIGQLVAFFDKDRK